jgi:uncharacterized membrane protein YdcZ (DUF606 family)
MLQKISYFNLIFAIIYVVVFFRDSSISFTMGIVMIVVFNWLALRSYQIDNYKWSLWHYIAGLWSLYYVGVLFYGTINVFQTVIDYQFASSDTLKFLILSTILSMSVVTQTALYFLKNLKEVAAD